MATIAIVGAGLIGRFLALSLVKQHEVTLFERGDLTDQKSTGRIAAAMVAPVAESVIASKTVLKMGAQSLNLWPRLLNSLALQTPFQQSGSLILAHRQDLNDIEHFLQRVQIKDTADFKTLTHQQLQQLEPELHSQFASTLWLPNEGHIDNGLLYTELESHLLKSEVTCITQTDVSIEGTTVKSNTGDKGPHHWDFDWVIDSRGIGAKNSLIDAKNSLRGVRGEVIRVRAPDVHLSRPVRLMHPRYPLYIVPKADHHYVIGATEIESEDERQPTVRSTLELLSAAYSVHKGFAEAEIIDIQSGLRPTLLDNEPAITVTGNNMQINGLYRHGFLLTPSLINQALNYLSSTGLHVDLLSGSEENDFVVQMTPGAN